MQKLSLLFSAFLILFTLPVLATDIYYVTGDHSIDTRISPNQSAQVVGTLQVGTPVNVLSVDKTTHFAQVKDQNNNIVWLPQNKLSAIPPQEKEPAVVELQSTIQRLTDQLNTLKAEKHRQHTTVQAELSGNMQTIHQLQQRNDTLQAQLTDTQRQLNKLNLQLNENKRAILLQWFMYGGGVAGAGLLLGLILPSLIPRRKTKRWMN